MLHPSIEQRYVPARRLWLRLLRITFGLAGMVWLLAYAVQTTAAVDLRTNQARIYLILLSVWGLDALRQNRRLTRITEIANDFDTAPRNVRADDLGSDIRLFAMTQLQVDGRIVVLPLVLWFGLAWGMTLVVLQYVRIGTTLFS